MTGTYSRQCLASYAAVLFDVSSCFSVLATSRFPCGPTPVHALQHSICLCGAHCCCWHRVEAVCKLDQSLCTGTWTCVAWHLSGPTIGSFKTFCCLVGFPEEFVQLNQAAILKFHVFWKRDAVEQSCSIHIMMTVCLSGSQYSVADKDSIPLLSWYRALSVVQAALSLFYHRYSESGTVVK